ncbi:Nif3-like dinuclear metal center hexameric protein [Colwellia psychrerythraea]|uniref:GTP cyclohydrolase 1 type 2 homolog n=1 Tax=Colwellia psychrerythraea TaxID=28229 RepID=A0A099KDK0_COLPS|nr:Nif3-like dinuclear metal center hexameric protein [Colwellia psychrerythraea]KGJ87613.1 NGG1p interacting factor 3 protein, NIF3 [Colwellia psychrerythraea]
MQSNELECYLTDLLKPQQIKDFTPNGLQIQGNNNINKVITGVTASKALINRAIAEQADAILVHHGYFWKNESYIIRGMKHDRIKALLLNDINLFAYHLPLDIHPTLGNNVQFAKLFNIQNVEPLEVGNALSVALQGRFEKPCSPEEFTQLINATLERECLHIPAPSNKPITTIAWCSGGGQGYIELAAEQGIDAFLTGEVSEQTTHIAHEMDIHFFAAGHHATERYGVKALGEHLAEKYGLEVIFVDIDNPV